MQKRVSNVFKKIIAGFYYASISNYVHLNLRLIKRNFKLFLNTSSWCIQIVCLYFIVTTLIIIKSIEFMKHTLRPITMYIKICILVYRMLMCYDNISDLMGWYFDKWENNISGIH